MADAPSLSEAGARLSRSAGLRIDDWQAWVAAVTQPAVLADVAAVAACCLVAWGIAYVLRARTRNEARSWGILLGDKGVDGVLFPALCLLLAWMAQAALAAVGLPTPLFRVALPALAALAVMQLGARVLRAAFPTAAGVSTFERGLSWVIWLLAVLWIIGLLPVLLEESETIRWKVGGVSLSLRTVLEAGVNVAVTLLLALWLSAALESRLLRNAKGDQLSTRKMIANALRVLLMFVAVMVSLEAVGIDLTALSVLGGAIGVGIGLGLQKLASSYFSGFVVLSERAIRIGDVVKIDDFEGQIIDIRARYTVIRGVNGAEAIVPNDTLVTQRIDNLSLADRRVWQTTAVSVAYGSDVDLVLKLLRDAACSAAGVLRQPPPQAYLAAFGDDGLAFTVGYWMNEPEAGQIALRSEVNLAILSALQAHSTGSAFPPTIVHPADAPAAQAQPAPLGG